MHSVGRLGFLFLFFAIITRETFLRPLIRSAEIDSPIIMLTAKDEESDIVRGLNLGADDYVTKPFSMKQLHARCNALIRRHASIKEEAYRFGDCCFQLDAREVIKSGRSLKLTPKESSLLALFLRREGHSLTREVILQAVWPMSLISSDRSVDRCVNTLRKKIEDKPKQPKHIVSLRDIGYKFHSN